MCHNLVEKCKAQTENASIYIFLMVSLSHSMNDFLNAFKRDCHVDRHSAVALVIQGLKVLIVVDEVKTLHSGLQFSPMANDAFATSAIY